MSQLRELIEFPVIYTFKAVGLNAPAFSLAVEEIFSNYNEKTIVYTESGGAKYVSSSITLEVKTYEELEALYTKIAGIPGLRFHV